MENLKINSKMLSLAKKSRELYDEIITQCAKECHISKQEADILLFFGNHEQLNRATDAVVYRGFSKAYVSKALTSLFNRGFIAIEDDLSDRRTQRILIMNHAKKIVLRLQKAQEEYFKSLKEGISEEDFAIHMKVIEQMAFNISKQRKG